MFGYMQGRGSKMQQRALKLVLLLMKKSASPPKKNTTTPLAPLPEAAGMKVSI